MPAKVHAYINYHITDHEKFGTEQFNGADETQRKKVPYFKIQS